MDSNHTVPGSTRDEPTLLDSAAVLLRHWKKIVLTTVAVALLMLLYGLLKPESFTSRVVLVPSSKGGGESRAALLAAQLRLPALGGGAGGDSDQLIVQAILKSTSLRDSVVNRVRQKWPQLDEPKLQRLFNDGMTVESDPTVRSITIDISAPEPQLAAHLASQIPAVVNSIAGRLSLEAAARRRERLDLQLQEARARLIAAEEGLRAFQERHGLPDVQEQARQTINAVAEVQQKISEQEIRVSLLRRSSTPDNPQYRQAVAELAAMREQLSRMGSGGASNDLLLPRGALPELRIELTRLMREYTTDEQIYLSLTSEMAGVQAEASNDMTVVSVLDQPAVPQAPSGPNLSLYLAAGLLLGAVLGVFWGFVADYLARARSAPAYHSFFEEWDRVRNGLVGPRLNRISNGSKQVR